MSGSAPASETATDPVVSVLVPVYKSGDMATATTERIFAALSSLGPVELLFCDDGSPDDSLEGLRRLRPPSPIHTIRVLSHPNRGLAFTLRRLIGEARSAACLYLDMDLSFDVTQTSRLLGLLDRYDIVVASKYVGREPRRVPFLRRICSVAFRLLVFAFSGTRIRDIGSGMVAFRRERVVALQLSSQGFAIHAELLDRAHLHGLSVREEPVAYAHRSGSFDVLRHGLVAVRDFFVYRMGR